MWRRSGSRAEAPAAPSGAGSWPTSSGGRSRARSPMKVPPMGRLCSRGSRPECSATWTRRAPSCSSVPTNATPTPAAPVSTTTTTPPTCVFILRRGRRCTSYPVWRREIPALRRNELALPGRVGACACDRERRDKAGVIEGGSQLVSGQDQRGPDEVVVMKPREDAGPESVAGAYRVHDLHRRGRDSHPEVAMGAERAVGAERDHDHTHALPKQIGGGGGVVTIWIEPGQVSIARLDDGAGPDQGVEAIAVRLIDEARPYIRVDHQETAGALSQGKFRQG